MAKSPGLPSASDYLRRFRETARAVGCETGEIGAACCGGPLPFARRGAATPDAPAVFVSAGIHGDEPAGPLALLALLTSPAFRRDVSWTLLPLMNPSGWEAGTRESAAGADLNRDYRDPTQPETLAETAWLRDHRARFDWAVNLHEDWEATGCYVYELRPSSRPSLARELLAATAAHLPVDQAPEIDGLPAFHGIITPSFDDSTDRLLWPESLRLARDHAPLVHTLETPSSSPPGRRVAAMLAALDAGVRSLMRPPADEDFMI